MIKNILKLLVSLSIALAAPAELALAQGPGRQPLSPLQGDEGPLLEQENGAIGEVDSGEDLVLVEEPVNEPKIQTDEVLPSNGYDEIQVARDFVVLVNSTPLTFSEAAEYNQMSDAQRTRFHETRRWILKKTAQALGSSQLGFGAVLVLKDKVMQFVPSRASLKNLKAKVLHPIQYLKGKLQLEPVEKREIPKRSPREAANTTSSVILNSVNRFLWERARVVADSDERGLSIAIGGQAELGGANRAIGGNFFLGLRIGYNRSKKSFVLDFFLSPEKFRSGAVIGIGLLFKVYPYIANRHANESKQDISGIAWYPPTPPIPLVGYGFEMSNTYLAAGWTSATLSLPGDLAALLNYTNSMRQKDLVHLLIPNPFARKGDKPIEDLTSRDVQRAVGDMSAPTQDLKDQGRFEKTDSKACARRFIDPL